ncbi:MAG: LarC family nickel insertion protein [Coriobacteriales bacterium]|nr:LarC family nickel insertion protein [Coriobacteriales bacterium]
MAVAEATVHGRPLDHVHFHEVGGADSIIDIVGSSFLLDRLQPTAVYATPLALGNGTFVCAHGELPVPAPATARIIEGLPVYASSHEGELTTPTGAALAKAFVTHWAPLPPLAPTGLGHGAGSRDLPGAPNVVRVIAGEPVSLAGLGDALTVEGCVLLHTNIDHRTPEELAFACEELLAAGALDVWQEPITMKKGRLAVRVSVLCHAARAQELTQKTIALTGSLGVRSQYVERTVIPREAVTLDTPYGPVPFKAAAIDTPAARTAWLRPEHEAVAHIARAQGLDYHTLYEELSGLARARCQHP